MHISHRYCLGTQHEITEALSSFPSGHASSTASSMLVLGIMWLRCIKALIHMHILENVLLIKVIRRNNYTTLCRASHYFFCLIVCIHTCIFITLSSFFCHVFLSLCTESTDIAIRLRLHPHHVHGSRRRITH